ncbi:DUF3662 and FHA domain-containing protein [Arcanobacterium sp. S3PF19]|uniref:FhaA domain-containing protein n=1 Tax=Arcanobacterium sp. S3PF19 TaxID=1219585 RepID=UPI000A42B6CF|nr:DUF3662 and FHA domain-containing protein [Arcanobacterium sp. S3PF19]
MDEGVAVGIFDRIERGVENAVDNAFSRAFRANLKPVELATGIKKSMDERSAAISRDRTIVPNDFLISLSSHDFEKISQWGELALQQELSSVAKNYAREQRYIFLGPIRISFKENRELPHGKIVVRGTSKKGAVAPATGNSASCENPILEIGANRYVLTGAVTVIGRGSNCDIPVDDAGVSRRHLELKITPHGVIASDLNSTNGTYVEGHRINKATLVDGNTVTIGKTQIMFWTAPETS